MTPVATVTVQMVPALIEVLPAVRIRVFVLEDEVNVVDWQPLVVGTARVPIVKPGSTNVMTSLILRRTFKEKT